MYFPDLSPYFHLENTVCVGWLDQFHDYPQGEVSTLAISKLEQILLEKRDVNKMRGTHPCVFCQTDWILLNKEGKQVLLGHSEIWIPNQKGRIYAAPSLVYHYIVEHRYQPPEEFIDAIEKLNLTTNWYEAEALWSQLRNLEKGP